MGRAVEATNAIRTVGLVLIATSIGLASWEVLALARTERDVGQVVERGQGEAFVQTALEEGQHAVFELCASYEGDAAAALGETDAAIFFVSEGARELAAETLVGEGLEGARREGSVVCAQLFRWERVLIPGTYAFGIANVPEGMDVQVRILAWRAPRNGARYAIGALFLGLLLAALGFGRSRSKPVPPTRRPVLRIGAGVLALLALIFGLSLVPASALLAPGEGTGASLAALVRGLAIALGGLGVALALGGDLAFRWKGAGVAAFAFAIGVVTFFLGRWVAQWFPSSGTAPIEAVLAAPSGSFALAIIGLVAPLAEELFFRGFVFGIAEERWGTRVAAALSVVCFALVHLPQQWGAWGAFASVSTAGLVFTLMRAKTGSSLGSGLAHLAHNGFITLLALL